MFVCVFYFEECLPGIFFFDGITFIVILAKRLPLQKDNQNINPFILLVIVAFDVEILSLRSEAESFQIFFLENLMNTSLLTKMYHLYTFGTLLLDGYLAPIRECKSNLHITLLRCFKLIPMVPRKSFCLVVLMLEKLQNRTAT